MTIRAITIDATTPGPLHPDQLATIIGDALADGRACWLPMPRHVTASTGSAAASLEFDGHDGEGALIAIRTWCARHKTRPRVSLNDTPEHGRHTLIQAGFSRKGIRFTILARVTEPLTPPAACRILATATVPPPADERHPADDNPAVQVTGQ
jgi:hypothetical protein